MPTITRAQLLEVTDRTLATALAINEDAESIRDEVYKTARNVKRVAMDWWVPRERCGCLIGTLRHRLGKSEIPPDQGCREAAETLFGSEFARELQGLLIETRQECGFSTPITVSEAVAA